MYVCMYACMHACMYACMYVCILSYPKVANRASGAATSTLLEQEGCRQHGLHSWEDEMSSIT
jgi:hypothetical protein